MKRQRDPNPNIGAIVTDLTFEFDKACLLYKETLGSRDSNRSKKELSRDNTKGTNIHKFQCNFAWILDSIQRGPTCLVGRGVDEANELISHITNISNI